MANLSVNLENNFTKGLITESTGLSFPEHASTDTDNCLYTLVGDVTRRPGMDFETNWAFQGLSVGNVAHSTYKWDNAGGDGVTQYVIFQHGFYLYMYKSSVATVDVPLSAQIPAIFDLSTFTAFGNTFDTSKEFQYADGNGYLFLFHPSCDPLAILPTGDTGFSVLPISINIRDFAGSTDNLAADTRPGNLINEHNYNLQNQGWTSGAAWGATSSDAKAGGSVTYSWNVGTGIVGITPGQIVSYNGASTNLGGSGYFFRGTATVISYAAGVLTLSQISLSTNYPYPSFVFNSWSFSPINTGYIGTFKTAEGVYPSNADVWWYFKDSTGVYNPAVTQPNVTLSAGNAPRGHFLLGAFNQDRASATGLSIPLVTTSKRPTTGTWFQGRVWYSGVNDSADATSQTAFYSWSSNIYFSQVVQSSTDFGKCYQVNDPTSENLFDLLPTDGGVITIPQCGGIYRLFPIQNGLLVFAANGVWFITGSQGIGFSANDYTVVQLSEIKSVSNTSFVNVQGLPYFWNDEGIYQVMPKQGGGLSIEPITVGTILTFYTDIPLQSRRYARGVYDPIEYVVSWIYRGSSEDGISNRYDFDRLLNYNVFNKAFFPYTISNENTSVAGITYVSSPGGTSAPEPAVKFATMFTDNTFLTFSELHDDTSWLDFKSFDGIGQDYLSYFITGYKLRGQALMKFQPVYIQMYSRMNDEVNAYKIQAIWDYAADRNSNRWSSQQLTYNTDTRYFTVSRRHKVRGHGKAVQFKVESVTGLPFDIQGWSVLDSINTGV